MLIGQHPEQQGQRVPPEQFVGGGVLGARHALEEARRAMPASDHGAVRTMRTGGPPPGGDGSTGPRGPVAVHCHGERDGDRHRGDGAGDDAQGTGGSTDPAGHDPAWETAGSTAPARTSATTMTSTGELPSPRGAQHLLRDDG